MVSTVKFNVGGRIFEVSRALVDEHSDSVLGKLVSDTWNDDPDKAVFIDRDGDIFAHILNYLRYGSIELPLTLPRAMFDRELDYYGLTSLEGVTDQGSLPQILDSFTTPVAEAQKKLDKAKKNHAIFVVAYEFYLEFCSHRFTNPKSNCCVVSMRKDHKSYICGGSLVADERRLFDTYFERYFGLKVPAESKVYLGGGVTQVICSTKN